MAIGARIEGIIFDLGGVMIGDFTPVFLANVSQELKVPIGQLRRVIIRELSELEQGKETSLQFWGRICKRLKIPPLANKTLRSLLTRSYIENTPQQRSISVN